jgi:hypothetical protein
LALPIESVKNGAKLIKGIFGKVFALCSVACIFSANHAAPKPKGLEGLALGFNPISAKIILRRFDGRMAFVREGRADRSQARSVSSQGKPWAARLPGTKCLDAPSRLRHFGGGKPLILGTLFRQTIRRELVGHQSIDPFPAEAGKDCRKLPLAAGDSNSGANPA